MANSPANRPFAGDISLGLENGSLVESVYFWNVWKGLHPNEAAIVFITSPGMDKDGHYPPVTAVTIYSTNGVVRAHSSEYGKVRLDTLKPDDLRKNSAHCLDEYLKAIANLPAKLTLMAGTNDEQVQRAFDTLHNPRKLSFFPVATAELPGLAGKTLIFDWNGSHYFWRPSTGAIREDTPKDPVTDQPLLCVQHGDLVESLIFVHDYKKLHPEEKAGLLFAPNDIGQGMDTIGLAAAAYTVQGVVHVRGYYFGDLVLDKTPHSFGPDDLVALSQVYKNLLVRTIGKFYQQTHSYESAPKSYWANVYNTLPSVFPQSLPGDTGEMQENRIYQRAKEDGIPCEIASNASRGRLVVLHWQAQRLCYAGNWNYYNGNWDATDLAEPVSAEEFLGLENGSLLESLHFRATWIKVHPEEDAIILITSPDADKDGKYPPVTAVTVYTNTGGKVWAHSTDYGTVWLDTLHPEDLKRNAGHCLDEYVKTVAKLPRKPVPVVSGINEQIQRAFDAVHDPKTMPYFPVAIVDIPHSIQKPDGQIADSPLKTIYFDWNDARYSWRPSTGTLRADLPKDPLTGRPSLCVNHGDLVESLVFVYDFLKAHPDEKAALLYAPQNIDQGSSTLGLAAAAYTLKGMVHVRGYFTPDFIPDTKLHPFKPDDLNHPATLALLYQLYKDNLLTIAQRYYAKAHPNEPPSNVLHDEIYAIHPPLFPQSLFGDTPEMQETRVFQRATEAGIPCVITEQKGLGRMVVLHWRAQRFCYTGNWRQTGNALSSYDGVWDPNDMERLIDAILFAHDFRPEQPGDAVVVLPYRQLGFWDIVKGIAVYARAGKVYAHNPEVGDAPIPGVNPSDLADPGKYRALRLAANKAIHAIDGSGTIKNNTLLEHKFGEELQAEVLAKSLQNDQPSRRRYIYEMLMRPGDMSKVDAPSVYEKLKAAGLDCHLFTTTNERGPDGSINEYTRTCVRFNFQGVNYTYGPEHYCSAANNLILGL